MSPYKNMPDDVKKMAEETEAAIKSGKLNPFKCPVIRPGRQGDRVQGQRRSLGRAGARHELLREGHRRQDPAIRQRLCKQKAAFTRLPFCLTLHMAAGSAVSGWHSTVSITYDTSRSVTQRIPHHAGRTFPPKPAGDLAKREASRLRERRSHTRISYRRRQFPPRASGGLSGRPVQAGRDLDWAHRRSGRTSCRRAMRGDLSAQDFLRPSSSRKRTFKCPNHRRR